MILIFIRSNTIWFNAKRSVELCLTESPSKKNLNKNDRMDRMSRTLKYPPNGMDWMNRMNGILDSDGISWISIEWKSYQIERMECPERMEWMEYWILIYFLKHINRMDRMNRMNGIFDYDIFLKTFLTESIEWIEWMEFWNLTFQLFSTFFLIWNPKIKCITHKKKSARSQ